MAQLILEPSNQSTSGEWRPDGALPSSVRDMFGRYPNIDEWKPGDLILFHIPDKTPWMSRLIIKAQSANYAFEHARWHHAAIYVGDGFLCEADVRHGVRHAPIHEYVGRHCIRVRRDAKLTEADQYKLAVRALTRLRQSYSFLEILKLAFQTRRGLWRPSEFMLSTEGMICSHLYNMAYQGVAKRILFDTKERSIIPAELSLTDVLTDVPVCWRRISKS